MSVLRTIKLKQWFILFCLFITLAFVISRSNHAKLQKNIPNLVATTNDNTPTTTIAPLETFAPFSNSQRQQQNEPSASPLLPPHLAYSHLPFMKYNRLSIRHQQILTSALAHIRLGYVANRTPDYDTPPLLILYSCGVHEEEANDIVGRDPLILKYTKNDSRHCGKLEQRLLGIVNSYYFSMLQQGSAFAYHMTSPVRIEWFFEPSPSYMSMNVDQAKFYLSKVTTTIEATKDDSSSDNKKKTKEAKEDYLSSLEKTQLEEHDFLQEYTSRGITLLHTDTNTWMSTSAAITPQWISMMKNPSMKALRDKYRLNHLPQPQSDAFWILSRLLFSKPSPAMRQLLTPYYDLMGGKFELWHDGTDLSSAGNAVVSPLDPRNTKVGQAFIETKKHWFRIGLRVTEKKQVKCLAQHVLQVCDKEKEEETMTECHIFVSTTTGSLLDQVETEFSSLNSSNLYVHAVDAKRYRFIDLDTDEDGIALNSDRQFSLFADSDEERYRKYYARVFMDWMILSRMDYLVGPFSSDFLKTAAWTAQVQTDVLATGDIANHDRCQIIPMSDW